MGRKVGAAVPLCVEELVSYLTVWPGPRPTSVPSGTLIYSIVRPQYTNVADRQTGETKVPYSIGQTVSQTVAE